MKELTQSQIEELFEKLGYCGNYDELSKGNETLEDFKIASRQYKECGKIEEGVVDGFNYLILHKAQAKKGDPREDVVVIDFKSYTLMFK